MARSFHLLALLSLAPNTLSSGWQIDGGRNAGWDNDAYCRKYKACYIITEQRNFIRENIQRSYLMAQTGVDAIEEGLTDDMRRVKDLLFGDTNPPAERWVLYRCKYHFRELQQPYQDGILPHKDEVTGRAAVGIQVLFVVIFGG